jgi:Arc/MetJ family transcription regulator
MILCMRTNIVLNDELVEEAMRLTGAQSKREAVETALRTLIETRAGEARRRSWQERVARVDQRVAGLRLRRRPSELVREDRDRR